MAVAEILPSVKKLNRYEKMRLVQILIDEMALEDTAFFEPDRKYEVWSPYDSFEAATTLQKMLDEVKL